MTVSITSVMTPDPVCVPQDATAVATAAIMRDNDIGAVVITDDGRSAGIVTDRDLVVRGIAEGFDPASTPVGNLASPSSVYLTLDSNTVEAVRKMRQSSVRRLPVCDPNGFPLGIVSLGDLAEKLDSDSALADISAATPDM